MEKNKLIEQLHILLQQLPQLEQIIVVLEGNRYTNTEITQKELWMSYHNVWNGCVLRTTHKLIFTLI